MNNKHKKKLLWQLPFITILIVGTVLILRQNQSKPYLHDSGMIFGTSYHITYQYDEDLHQRIMDEMMKVDRSLSPFNERSIISAVNRNEQIKVDTLFMDVFQTAMHISEDTDGAFDITVAPLVNAWGFGFKNEKSPSAIQVDSLLQFTGYKKVSLVNQIVKKTDDRMMLDCSAIAKGYGCDRVAALLRQHGIKNFMVEIGGEIVTCGKNPRQQAWMIGVTKPTDDSLSVEHELQTIVNVTDRALATSGNYRNFYYKDGKKYAHTIDPKTGYPVQHTILSATVVTDCCVKADAYATAFMVMGMERAKALLARHPELMAYFVYSDANGDDAVWCSPGFKTLIAE